MSALRKSRLLTWLRRANVARVQFSIKVHNQLGLPGRVETAFVACPLCGNQSDFEVRYRPFIWSPIKIVGCICCDLSFLQPMPTPKFYDWYYGNMNMPKVTRRQAVVDSDTRQAAIYRGYARHADQIADFVIPRAASRSNPVILEIGAAHGSNLTVFKRHYSKLELFEDELDRRWSPMYDEHGIVNWNRRPPGTRADIIIMSHVLEHFPDPVQALIGAVQGLAEGGVFYIEVPNIPEGPQPSLPYKLVHTMYFSGKTLSSVAERAGLTKVAFEESDVISSVWRLG